MTDLRQRLRSGYLLLDGAMGTQLQAAGLKLGELPELLCFTDPAVVANIHRRYIAAGSQVIYANTFQANGYKLKNSPGHHQGHPAGAGRRRRDGDLCGLRLRPHRAAAGAIGHPIL